MCCKCFTLETDAEATKNVIKKCKIKSQFDDIGGRMSKLKP